MLQKKAEELPEEPFPIALDWFNGRRYPNTDDFQRSAISGLSLGMDAPYLYRSLVFGAVCGLYRLIEGFEKQEIDIEKMIDALGNIYINGELLSESYGKEAIKDPGMAANSIYLGSDEYFVLGDNRNNSSDSRDPSVGLIKRDQIIGRAWLRIFPFDKIGFVVHGK